MLFIRATTNNDYYGGYCFVWLTLCKHKDIQVIKTKEINNSSLIVVMNLSKTVVDYFSVNQLIY